MNWFWLRSQDRKREAERSSVTVTEQAKVAVLPVPDAEVRAAEDERRMQVERDCIEYGRRHYAALPTGNDSPAPGPCPKCTKYRVRVTLVEQVDAHSSECELDATAQRMKRDGWGMPLLFRQHFAECREVLRVTCSTCGFERGLVLPADAEVNQ